MTPLRTSYLCCQVWLACTLLACGSGDAARDHDAAAPDCWHEATADSSGRSYELPAPRGKLGVARGVRRTLIDEQRDEPFTDDTTDTRVVALELYYPTERCSDAPAASYLDAVEAEALWPIAQTDDWWRAVRTHTVADAPMIDDGERHPVLLLSHGHGGYVRLHGAYIEELVSHGYVVAAITHTYWGLSVLGDGTALPSKAPPDPLSDATYAADTQTWMEDQRLVLDALEALDAHDPAGEVTGRLDLAHVGAFGYSFGGSSSLNLLAEDERIAAAVDLDGAIHREPNATKPALLLLTEHSLDPTWRQFFYATTGPAWIVELRGAEHGDLDDTGVLSSQAAFPLDPVWYGPIDKPRALRVVNDYLLAFFDRFLRDGRDGHSALLDADTAEAPAEIVVLDRK